MNPHIAIAIHGVRDAIRQSKGPVFTAEDYGRFMCAVIAVYAAMEAHNEHVTTRVEEENRLKKADEKRMLQQELSALANDLWSDDDE